MIYTIYNPETGQILKTYSVSTEDISTNPNLMGQSYILGDYDSTKFYIENSIPIALPKKPKDSLEYSFDWSTKTWILDINASKKIMRGNRNILLGVIDKVNPIWYDSLTDEQKTELQTYRQALLDVPQQTGFPTEITWPTKPTWL